MAQDHDHDESAPPADPQGMVASRITAKFANPDRDLSDVSVRTQFGTYADELQEEAFVAYRYNGHYGLLTTVMISAALGNLLIPAVNNYFDHPWLGLAHGLISVIALIVAAVNVVFCSMNAFGLSVERLASIHEKLNVVGYIMLIGIAQNFEEHAVLCLERLEGEDVSHRRLMGCYRTPHEYLVLGVVGGVLVLRCRYAMKLAVITLAIALRLAGRAINQPGEPYVFWLRVSAEASISIIFGVIAAFIDIRDRRRFERALVARILAARTIQTRDRLDATLRILLPVEVVAAMASGEQVLDISKHATVSVCDVNNFVQWSLSLVPKTTVEVLNVITALFDEEVARLGLRKIKTLGDRYITGTSLGADDVQQNVPPSSGTTNNSGSISLLKATQRMNSGSGGPGNIAALAAFQHHAAVAINRRIDVGLIFHIGIHSGPCFGAVVGTTSLSYEVFGEAVLVASSLVTMVMPGDTAATEVALEDGHFSSRCVIRPGFDPIVFQHNKKEVSASSIEVRLPEMSRAASPAASAQPFRKFSGDSQPQAHLDFSAAPDDAPHYQIPPACLQVEGSPMEGSLEPPRIEADPSTPKSHPASASGLPPQTTQLAVPPMGPSANSRQSSRRQSASVLTPNLTSLGNTVNRLSMSLQPSDLLLLSAETRRLNVDDGSRGDSVMMLMSLERPELSPRVPPLSPPRDDPFNVQHPDSSRENADDDDDDDTLSATQRTNMSSQANPMVQAVDLGKVDVIVEGETGAIVDARDIRRALLRDMVHSERLPMNDEFLQHLCDAVDERSTSRRSGTGEEIPDSASTRSGGGGFSTAVDPRLAAVRWLYSLRPDSCLSVNAFREVAVEEAYALYAQGATATRSFAASLFFALFLFVLIILLVAEVIIAKKSNIPEHDFNVKPAGVVLVCLAFLVALVRGVVGMAGLATLPANESAVGAAHCASVFFGLGLLGTTVVSNGVFYAFSALVFYPAFIQRGLRFPFVIAMCLGGVILPWLLVTIVMLKVFFVSQFISAPILLMLMIYVNREMERLGRMDFVDACVEGIGLHVAADDAALHRTVLLMFVPRQFVGAAIEVCEHAARREQQQWATFIVNMPSVVVINIRLEDLLPSSIGESRSDWSAALKAVESTCRVVQELVAEGGQLHMVGGFGDNVLIAGPLAESDVAAGTQASVSTSLQQTLRGAHSTLFGGEPSPNSGNNAHPSPRDIDQMPVHPFGQEFEGDDVDEVEMEGNGLSQHVTDPIANRMRDDIRLHTAVSESTRLLLQLRKRLGSKVTAIGVVESAFGTITGRLAPSFALTGVATRQARALLDASSTGYVGVNQGFVRATEESTHMMSTRSTEHPPNAGSSAFGPGEIWAVRGVGKVRMSPLVLN